MVHHDLESYNRYVRYWRFKHYFYSGKGILPFLFVTTRREEIWMRENYKVVIIGGGTGGITTAARLLRGMKALAGDVAIIDPAEKH